MLANVRNTVSREVPAVTSAMQQSIMSAACDLPGKLLVRIQPANVFYFSVERREAEP